jgi:hypothetical protein
MAQGTDPLRMRIKRLVFSTAAMVRLRVLNTRSRSMIVGKNGPVVSMTSYGPRLSIAYVAIESIAIGTLKPSRVILWLDDEDFDKARNPELERLTKRGLEIKRGTNYGPHTKFYPFVSTCEINGPLVTADDDVIYPKNWLKGLHEAFLRNPSAVHAYKARRMLVTPEGDLSPYVTWEPSTVPEPSFLNFALGVSGVIYPQAMQQALRAAGELFLVCTPRNDDVWLHAVAVRSGIKVGQVSHTPLDFPTVRGTHEFGLMINNVIGGQNDDQIQDTYNRDDIARMTS